MKLLAAPDPLPALDAMQGAGVLAQLLPEATVTERFERLTAIEYRLGKADPIRRLAALIVGADDASAAANAVIKRWRLTGADGMRLVALVAPQEFLTSGIDSLARQRLIYRLGKIHARDLVLLAGAERGENEATVRAMLDTVDRWNAPKLPVTGADVMERGIPVGPEFGRLLRAVEDWWIEHDFEPDRAAALERLDAIVAERREK